MRVNLRVKPIEGYRIALDQRFPIERTAHQPCHLLAGVAGEAFEIAQHHVLVGTPEAAVAQAYVGYRHTQRAVYQGLLYPLEVAVGGEACAWSSSERGVAVSTGILVLHGSA
jgi:hypothetical protein